MFLLIDCDNTPDIYEKVFTKRVVIKPTSEDVLKPDFTIDLFLDEKLSEIFDKYQDIKVIGLPYSLDENNPLTYTGLRAALHIRLTKKWGCANVPIIFLGPDTTEDILKLSSHFDILATAGIFKTDEIDETKIVNYLNNITNFEYQNFLNRIKINPPSFYDNRHSIANEWGIMELNNVSGHNLTLDSNLTSDLYFKSKQVTSSQYNKYSKNPLEIDLFKGKRILLVDDEKDKGWEELFKVILPAEYTTLEISKDDKREEIITKIDTEIDNGFNYDLVLLDIRLCDEDHQTENNKEFTGFKILKKIKDFNPGIQVIIITASNKIWNFKDAIFTHKANGFIQKNGIDKIFTKKDWDNYFKDFYGTLENCSKSLFLSNLYKVKGNIISKIIELKKQKKLHRKTAKSIISYIEISFDSLVINFNKNFTTSFLNSFQILELFIKEYINDKGKKESTSGKYIFELRNGTSNLKSFNRNTYVVSGLLRKDKSYPNYHDKLHNVLYLIGGISDKEIYENSSRFIDKRNNFIHPGLDIHQSDFSSTDIEEIFEIIHLILKNI